MAQGVVDVLEVVEIDEQHRELSRASVEPYGRMIDPIPEQGLVGKTGEGIVQGLMGELLLELLLLRDVSEAPHPTDHRVDHPPWEGVAFEHAAVFELEYVVTVRFRSGVQFLDLGQERVGIAELVDYPRQRLAVVPGGQHLVRNLPQLYEPAIEARDL